MKGRHHITIETNRVKYEFYIVRNITIIQGDSATGKTTLVDLLRQYYQRGSASGVSLSSDKHCAVYGGGDSNWKPIIESEHDSIIFIDEDFSFIYKKEFAETVRTSDNYFVLITRRPIKTLPYSVNEIYGIRTSGKYHFPEKVYNEFYPLYPETLQNNKAGRAVLLVEDANSGFQFFSRSAQGIECLSASGNGNVFSCLMALKDKSPVAVIADGAAFGAFIESVLSISEARKDVSLFLPESFEWLILKSGVIGDSSIKDILDAPEEYIESSEYFSWERFFYSLLESKTRDNKYMHYSKTELPEFYVTEKNKQQILKTLPEQLQRLLQSQI